MKESIVSCIPFQEGLLPTKYLGLELTFGTPKKIHFQNLISKVHKLIEAWQSVLLSRAGRLILIKHVLNVIPSFAQLAFSLPAHIIQEIEKAMRAFLWNSTISNKKAYWVKWAEICKPVDEGGLGLRSLTELNEVCRIKRTWKLLTANSIWAHFMRQRYLKNGNLSDTQAAHYGSCLWKEARAQANFIRQKC